MAVSFCIATIRALKNTEVTGYAGMMSHLDLHIGVAQQRECVKSLR